MNFLRELIGKLIAKAPGFFKFLKVLAVIAAIVTGLPEILAYFQVELGSTLSALASKGVAIASAILAFLLSVGISPEEAAAAKAKK